MGVAAAVVVGAVALGSFVIRGDSGAEPEPAPSPTLVERPLVYAAGATVHVGDETFDAGATVVFVDATDDGVVFTTEDDSRLWFHDGSTAEVIGLVPIEFALQPDVDTANPGSLVVWTDAASPSGKRPGYRPTDKIIYDTSQRAVVGRLPAGEGPLILHVGESHVFYVPTGTRGCWVIDSGACSDRQAVALRRDVRGDQHRLPRIVRGRAAHRGPPARSGRAQGRHRVRHGRPASGWTGRS